MRSALIPGSFDPITLGHLDVIERVAARFDRVYVAVMTNDMQKYVQGVTPKEYMFTQQERLEMTTLACQQLSAVEVISSGSMLIDLASRLEVDWVIKGLRNVEDYTYEQAHALWNRAHNASVETMYLPTDPRYAHISSTRVRACIETGEIPDTLLPPQVATWIRSRCVHPVHPAAVRPEEAGEASVPPLHSKDIQV